MKALLRDLGLEATNPGAWSGAHGWSKHAGGSLIEVANPATGSVIAAVLFAALQTGGFAMERSVEIPRVLTMVLQSVIILFLAMRGAIWKRA